MRLFEQAEQVIEKREKPLAWTLGRGASISCGLAWYVREKWKNSPREELIEKSNRDCRDI
jgi:hypothetical protein